jgi:MFS family permease
MTLGRGFAALHVHNFQLWFAGQAISVSGTWMQTTALGWLVVLMTGDGVALGLMLSLQYLPLLLLGPIGGSLVDRVDVRRAVIASNAALGVLALVLYGLVVAGRASMPAIYLISLLSGVVGMIDNPARRALVSELVPRSQISSAISLTGVLVNTSRVAGPAVAAVVIGSSGVEPCFLLNALSYGFVVLSLLAMNRAQLIPREARAPGPARIVDTLRYVRGVPSLRRPLAAMAIVGTFAFEFSVVLPLLASQVFGGDGSTYGIFLVVLSIGGILGSLAAGLLDVPAGRWLETSLLLFGGGMLGCAIAPSIPAELVALFLTGIASFAFVAVGSASVQVTTNAEHRGRVLALWSMAFLGTTMIGAPAVGWVAASFGPRAAVIVGAASCLVAGAVVLADRAQLSGSTR